MNGTKICAECGRELPTTQFNKNRNNKDGLQDRCRDCFSAYNKKRYASNKEQTIAAVRAYRSQNPLNVFETRMRMCAKNPTKKNAHRAVDEALRCRLIEKPSQCSGCGKEATRLEAHHHDYSKPLEIIWLCKKCHMTLDENRCENEGVSKWPRSVPVEMTVGEFPPHVFPSIAAAAKFVGCSPSSIRQCLEGKSETCKGATWRYAKDQRKAG